MNRRRYAALRTTRLFVPLSSYEVKARNYFLIIGQNKSASLKKYLDKPLSNLLVPTVQLIK